MDDFEKMLTELPKPEVKELRHEDMLAADLIRAKDKAATGLWWLLVPLYVLTMLLVRTLYKKTSLAMELNAFYERSPLLALLLFIAAPLLLLVLYWRKQRRKISSPLLFERRGVFFVPINAGGWLIFSAAICCAVYNAYLLNDSEHSVSDFFINLLFSLLLIGAVYSLVAYLTLKKRL